MELQKLIQYTDNGIPAVEKSSWVQVGIGNPNGVALPGESGLWMLKGLSNPARDTTGLITPSTTTKQVVINDSNGEPDIVSLPVGVDLAAGIFDYFNLPLRAGVVLV